jgi:DNA-binding HxlR family transcriptional regulator
MRKYGVDSILWLLASCPNLTTSEISKAINSHRQNVERKLSKLMEKDLVNRVMLKVPFENKNGVYYRLAWCYSLTKPPMRIETSGRVLYDKYELDLIDYLSKYPDSSFSELRQGIQPEDWRRMQKRLMSLQRQGMVSFEDDLRTLVPGGKLQKVRTYHLA